VLWLEAFAKPRIVTHINNPPGMVIGSNDRRRHGSNIGRSERPELAAPDKVPPVRCLLRNFAGVSGKAALR